MKRQFINFQFAPKSTGANKVATDTKEEGQETGDKVAGDEKTGEDGDKPADEPAKVAVPEKVYTSDKLTELQAEEARLWDVVKGLLNEGKMGSKEFNDANLAIYKVQADVKAEIANLKNIEQQQILAEKRQARLQLIANRDAARDANMAAQADANMSQEDKNAAYDEFKKHNEILENELLAKFGTSKPSTPAKDGVASPSTPAGGGKGSTGDQIRSRYIALTGGGMTATDAVKTIIGEGFSRGTTGAVVLAYQRSIGEK